MSGKRDKQLRRDAAEDLRAVNVRLWKEFAATHPDAVPSDELRQMLAGEATPHINDGRDKLVTPGLGAAIRAKRAAYETRRRPLLALALAAAIGISPLRESA